MKWQQRYFKQSSFRFRRWSRKGYAAFFSLKRAVTIGQLSSNVSERFQVKNGANHSSVLVAGERLPLETREETGERPGEEDTFQLALLLLLLFPLQTVKQVAAAGSSRVHYIIYILKRGCVKSTGDF